MRCVSRWIGWAMALLLGLPLFLAALVVLAANTRQGRDWIERTVPNLTGGKVVLGELGGRFPDAPRIGHIGIADSTGPWLAIDNLALDWSPSRLLAGVADIQKLEAGHIAVERPPAPSPPESEPSPALSLPVGIRLRSLRVQRLDLAPAVAGIAAALSIDGAAWLAAPDRGGAELSIRRLDGDGSYQFRGHIESTHVEARLSAREPGSGLLASLAKLPELGALDLDAELNGPYSIPRVRLNLAAGPLQASVRGALDLDHDSADLAVTAAAPAMQPRPDLSWHSMALDAKVHGPFVRPAAQATLRIKALNAAGTAIPETAMEVRGDAGEVHLRASFAGIRIPGPRPELLQAAPLSLEAQIRLDAPDRPVSFAVKHPLLAIDGKAAAGGEPRGEATLKLPDLAPWAAAAGLESRGSSLWVLRAATRGDTTQIEAEGKLAVIGGMEPLPALVGESAKLGFAIDLRGSDITLSRLRFDGKALTLSADGTVSDKSAELNWKLGLAELAAVTPTLSGRAELKGQVAGPRDNLTVTADLQGELAAKGLPRGPVAAKLRLQGLPRSPSGALTAQGMLNGAQLQLALEAQRGADGATRIAIQHADWKSAHGEGALTLPKDANLPIGKIDLRMARLEDLQALLGQPLAGSASASLEATEREGRLRLEGHALRWAETASVGHAALDLAIADPAKHPVVNGRLALEDIAAGAIDGSAKLEAQGPATALGLRWSADLRNLGGAGAQLAGVALLDIPARKVAVSDFQANWKQETLRLLEPARIGYGDGLTVDRLRIGFREAVLEVVGRATPTLDLDVELREVSANLAGLFVPGLGMDGTLRAEARLSGTPARPSGIVKVEASGLRAHSGPGRALPPVNLIASADLAGTSAHLDSSLKAGSVGSLAVTGQAPLVPAREFGLRATGALDLKLLDPLLMAQGRRVRGQIALQGNLAGTLAEPRLEGTMQLDRGEVQDFTQGLHIADISALLQAEGDTIRVVRFQGRAGPGTLSLGGSMGPLAPNPKIDLSLTARNARPLDSDRLTVSLNADLTLRGRVAEHLDAAGIVRIQRAEIRIPEHMPTGIAVLDVRKPGAPPPPPPPPGPELGLDLTLTAPDEIFVRGRGLDAELGGTVHLRGATAKPRPEGHFEMRRGEFSLAGKTLIFSKGVVGFDGGKLSDPSLDFTANTTSNNITATLGVGGTARKPRITLSSVPELPPDEVLAQLLFGHSTASLGPLEMVQIASAVASLTGVASGVGDPLDSVRKGLRLDRLAIGGGGSGGPTLEAGRYVAPGVFVGAKQGISGSGTQGMVQIDITRGLKVEGSVGTGSASTAGANAGTNSVGVIYQIEY